MKPTGLERTFPNLLTSEGVMNLEYDKWDPLGIPPEHELTVPFTRMLAGPLDFLVPARLAVVSLTLLFARRRRSPNEAGPA
jgi:hypothetical protein